jgi:hypothetical protein
MAEQEESLDTPESKTGDETPKNDNNEYYKVYKTEQEYKESQDKFFRNAYNEGKGKQSKDFLSELSGLGIEADSLDSAFEVLKGKFSGGGGDEKPSESEELRNRLNAINEEKEKLANELRSTKISQKKRDGFNEAVKNISDKGELKLDMKSIETLFESEYEVREQDGNLFAFKDDVPLLKDDGSRMSLSESFERFIESKSLITPTKKGVGGRTGSAGFEAEKPKKSEWRELIKSSSASSEKLAAEMYNLSKEVGWADE